MSQLQGIEEEIVNLFKKGHDNEAMDRLYEAYGSYLAGVCLRYIPDDDQRKDILQECLVKIFTQIDQFEYRGKGSLKAWMARIAVNESLSQLRKDKTRLLETQEERLPDLPDEEPETDDLTAEEIAQLLGQLPKGYRTVINLYAVEGKSHKEIAAILGIKPDTSASQLHRARNLLAKMVKEYKLTR